MVLICVCAIHDFVAPQPALWRRFRYTKAQVKAPSDTVRISSLWARNYFLSDLVIGAFSSIISGQRCQLRSFPDDAAVEQLQLCQASERYTLQSAGWHL